MRHLPLVLVAGALAWAGCGDDDETPAARAAAPSPTAAADTRDADDAATATREADGRAIDKRDGTELVIGNSEFGEMVYDSGQQAIYIFENDPAGESACYDECAEAWPPVLTTGDPVAGAGVDADLLGTTERRDGEVQVTYDGQPLYYYAHEQPGEVRCHNINLNGGFWWVIGPDGERRP